MKKLPIKDKIFWKNFGYFILFFSVITIAIAYYSESYEDSAGLIVGYVITSAFCVLLLGVKIGEKYSNYEDIEEKKEKFLEKHNMTNESYGKKYEEVIAIYRESVRVSDYGEKYNYDIYEFVNEDGMKEVYTIGYEKNGKFDIYWEDIIASKNNKNGVLLSDGTKTIDTSIDENNTELINKKCPYCTGNVDRFIYVNNFSKSEDDYGDVGWMEVCWKCRKVLFIDINTLD
jgi:hypothetical protein